MRAVFDAMLIVETFAKLNKYFLDLIIACLCCIYALDEVKTWKCHLGSIHIGM